MASSSEGMADNSLSSTVALAGGMRQVPLRYRVRVLPIAPIPPRSLSIPSLRQQHLQSAKATPPRPRSCARHGSIPIDLGRAPKRLHRRAPPVRPASGYPSPTRSTWCRTYRGVGRRRVDCGGLNGRFTLVESPRHPGGQDSHKQQERPGALSREYTSRPKACRHSRGRNRAGVEK
jgi:hypothetical protein